MLKKNLIFIFFICISASIYGQSEPAYNDTSYFIPFDDDFNLIISASKGHLKNVQNLLDRGADINAVTVDNISALMYATENGDFEMVRFLLQKGANPNIRPYNGITALISAAKLNHQQIAELLINNGAKINAADEGGVTAIHYAVAYNFSELTEMLLFYNANPEIPDKAGTTPIITAAYNNSFESLKTLVQNNVNVNSQDKQGFTPLMVAIQENNKQIVNYLIENNADIDRVNKGGMTALAFAIKSGDYEMTKKLINKGASVDHRITGSLNLLRLSMKEDEEEIAELLITEGAHPVFAPDFNKLSIGPGIQFNGDDFFTSVDFSLNDSRYNTAIEAGFGFRPTAMRIFTQAFNDTLYQYWERRYFFYAGLVKRFAIINPIPQFESGPFAGIRTVFSFGAYRGANSKPDHQFLISPLAGWYLKSNKFSLRLNYEYLNFKIDNISPHRLNLSFAFSIPLANKKLMEKEIYWLQYE